MKVLGGASDDRILGFTMIGAEAGEVMAVVQTAMLADMPYTGLRDAVIAHPTMAEGLGTLFSNVPARLGQKITAKRGTPRTGSAHAKSPSSPGPALALASALPSISPKKALGYLLSGDVNHNWIRQSPQSAAMLPRLKAISSPSPPSA